MDKLNRKTRENTILYIVVPCYNEAKVLPITSEMFLGELNSLVERGLVSDKSRILFVDDGSKDDSWERINSYARSNEHFLGIAQSRNRGHQNAVLAGLMEAYERQADITISIDCDGQDDVKAMEEMVKEYYEGCEVVYGVRNNRRKDTFFKRKTAEGFYKFMNFMGAEVVYNHADYRLLSRRAIKELKGFREVNLFLRGMIPLVGFKSTSVYYERQERIAGKSHYPLSKMMGLAFDGVTSMSIKPIRIIMLLGILVAALSFAGIVWAVVTTILGQTVAGWASTVCIVCFLSGVQMVSIGVIGEYIGKIYMEVKDRPRYIISERTYEGDEEHIEND